jgi:hypothetical protein
VPTSVVGKVSQSTGSQIASHNLPAGAGSKFLIDNLRIQGVKVKGQTKRGRPGMCNWRWSNRICRPVMVAVL